MFSKIFIKKIFLILFGTSLSINPVYGETLTLSTYYPAPFGAYDSLRLYPQATALPTPCDIGTLYVQSVDTLWFCRDNGSGQGVWGFVSGVWTQSGNNIYLTNNDTNPNLKVGVGTSTPEFKLHLAGDGGILATGTFLSGTYTLPDGAGTRLVWYPRRSVFRAGGVTGIQWSEAGSGNYSTAFGFNTTAQGVSSFAAGQNTIAQATSAMAFGDSTSAQGTNSAAFGYQSRAMATNSFAFGNNTNAGGTASIAMGRDTEAEGTGSLAMGYNTTANATYAVAMGQGTLANASTSTAIGYNTTANATNATAIGHGNQAAMASNATAIGRQVIVQGANSLAIALNDQFGVGPLATGNTMAILGGRVGINSPDPQGLLHIHAGVQPTYATSTKGALEGDILITTNDPELVFIGQDQSSAESAIKFSEVNVSGNYTNNWTMGRRTTSSGGRFFINYTNTGSLGDYTYDSNNRLTMLPNGNIGLYISSPQAKLHLANNGGLAFTHRGTTLTFSNIPAFMSSTNDGFLLIPTTVVSDSDLRLYIEDDSTDSFSIYGNSCGGGSCGSLSNSLFIARFMANGFVGIGDTSPAYRLEIGGGDVNTTAGGYLDSGSCVAGSCASDVSLKKNIQPLTGALDKITQLNPVSFEFIDDQFGPGSQVGLIAQEVEKVFPEWVSTADQGYKNIHYGLPLQMHLIQAAKELDNELGAGVNALKEEGAVIKEKLEQQRRKIEALRLKMNNSSL